jgi:hypothetical protein
VSTSSILRDNSKALYQPWREEAFRADEYVQALAPVEKWMLRALLQAAFVCSQRPYLPDDDARLWVLAGCDSQEQWDQHKVAVRALFTPIQLDGQKLLSQKKLIEDWDRMSKVRSARAEAGRKGGLAKGDANNCQYGYSEKEKQTEGKQMEAKQTELSEPNQPNRSELTEVSSLPIASNRLTIARVSELAGGTVASTLSGNGVSSGLVCSPLDSLRRPSANTATGRSRSPVEEQTNPEGAEKVKPKGSGQGKRALSDWESAFQREVQRTAADLDYDGHGVVFTVPLPDKVFRWVEQTANKTGLAKAQNAVTDWLEARNFNALANPNVVWDKMEDEILRFIDGWTRRKFQ